MPAPALPLPNHVTVTVSNVAALYKAVAEQQPNTTILLEPGRYRLSSSTLAVTADNVTIRGREDNCDSVELIGPGMDNRKRKNVDAGFWINAANTTIANLTISDVYFHSIQINGTASAPRIYNVRMVNSGQQFVKANPLDFGNGVDNGIVEYSIMEYPDGPSRKDHADAGTGYTGGVDIHAGKGWRISNNEFRNFHTPDNSDHLWNPAVLVWNGAENTITENNVFIDVNRAIAYGLSDTKHDHRGGVIRNNMIIMTPGLYSKQRTASADGVIIVWDSPDTKVLHNTVLTNSNTPNSIEVRFETLGVEVSNNIVDAPITHRDNKFFLSNGNIESAKPNWFVDPVIGNLRLKENTVQALKPVKKHRLAEQDIDGEYRPFGIKVNVGADQLTIAN